MNQPPSQHYPTTDAPAQEPRHGGRGWIVIVLVLLVVGGGGFRLWQSHKDSAGAPGKGAPPNRPVPVVVSTVEKKDVPIYLDGLGNVLPTYTVTVHTQVNGPLVSVNFKEGQFVHKGDLLAQVDPRPYLATLHNAQAALARDQATLKNAELNLERYRELRSQKLIAEQQYTDQVALKDSTVGTIQTDKAAIESAELNVEYSSIRSPIDGVTGVRLIDPGNLVQTTDSSGLVVITQLDPITVLFTLPEDNLPGVQEELAKGPLPVEAYSRDGLHDLGTGTLTFIDNQINQTTATIRLRATFPNPKSRLWPNEFVKARLHLTTERGALVVPAVAVQRGPHGTFLYAVGPDNTAVLKTVKVASLQGDDAILKSGVDVGDRVVTDGQNQLKPGSKVQERAPDAKATGASSAAPSDVVPPAPSSSVVAPTGSAGPP